MYCSSSLELLYLYSILIQYFISHAALKNHAPFMFFHSTRACPQLCDEHAHSSLPKRPNDTRTVNEVSPSSLFLRRRVAKASEQQKWPSERAIDVDADTGSR